MDNASAWGALGAGLSTLGEGLNAMQLRKLAEAQRKREEDRQKEQDALEKAIAQANAAKGLRAENFTLSQKAGIGTNSPDAMKAILNRAAMNKGGEDVTDPVSGDTYYRAPGDSPLDIQQAQKERDFETKQTLARIAAENAAERERIKQEALNGRWGTASGNVIAQEVGRNDRWGKASGNVIAQQAGATERTGMQQTGANTRSQNAITAKGVGGRQTEAQAKAETFSGLMSAAEQEISKNPWGTKPLNAVSEIALKGDGTGLVANAAAALARAKMTPEQQRAMQSRYQFTQAALYAFSGQSAPNSEVAKNIAIFFPQSGETDPTLIDQKNRMRATATMLLAKRKAGMLDGAVPLSPDAATGGSGISNLNGLGRP